MSLKIRNYLLKNGIALLTGLAIVTSTEPTLAQDKNQNLEKHALMLDWFPNADHVPLYVAEQDGFFAREGLTIELLAPADPNDALKLTAAAQIPFAINYQPSVIIARDKGLPVKSVGVLVDQPLSCIAFLKNNGITTVSDLKGKTIGYSVQNLELALLNTVMAHYDIQPGQYRTVNVNFNLVQSLLTKQVDAVIGAFWNYEMAELELEGIAGNYFALTDHGVPHYDELVVISHDRFIVEQRDTIIRFQRALQSAIDYTKTNPQKAFQSYLTANPQVRKELDKKAFMLVLDGFADTQKQTPLKWKRFVQYALKNKLIAKQLPVSELIF